MLAIHPNARTTPAVRAEIARSSERSGVLAERHGVSTETVRKGRRRRTRGRPGPRQPAPPAALEGHRGGAGGRGRAARRATGFPLDDLTFVVRLFLPHLD